MEIRTHINATVRWAVACRRLDGGNALTDLNPSSSAKTRTPPGTAAILVFHDLAMVEYLCDRVGVMYHGKLVKVALMAALFADPQHSYTKALISAIPIPDPILERKRQRVEFYELSMDREERWLRSPPGRFVLRREGGV